MVMRNSKTQRMKRGDRVRKHAAPQPTAFHTDRIPMQNAYPKFAQGNSCQGYGARDPFRTYMNPSHNSADQDGFTVVGNMQQYNVFNDDAMRPVPTKLNNLPTEQVQFYGSVPYFGTQAPSIQNVEVASQLRPEYNPNLGANNRYGDRDLSRWAYIDPRISSVQHTIFPFPRSGISTHVMEQNFMCAHGC